MDGVASEQALRRLVDSIVDGDNSRFSGLLSASPVLALARFSRGATRQDPGYYIEALGQHIYVGDTALHFAAASYRHGFVLELIKAGANVRGRNRRGVEPIHAAAVGSPGSPMWHPEAQAAVIATLVEAGADPNAQNTDGATPLHRAVRTRCASAVQALLDHGAEPAIRNKNGSTAMQLALRTTGRSGSGSPQAKSQNEQILRLLHAR